MRGSQLVRLFLDCVALNGHTGIVNVLIANGSDVNAVDDNEYTPLHEAGLSTRARGSLQRSAAPHARQCSARTAREAAH